MNHSHDMRRDAVRRGVCIVAAIALQLIGSAQAATCLWNSANGDWSTPGNWTGCADQVGPSTRSPGPTDIAIVANGVANLAANPIVAELELGSNGEIHTMGSTRELTISAALRLNGGRTTTILGTNQLQLVLAAGAIGSLTAPTSLDDATFLLNSGTLAIGSSSGVALSLRGYAQLQNMAGGTITMTGSDSRLYLETGAEVINNVGATLTIVGSARIGKPVPVDSSVAIRNFGSMSVSTGGLDIPGGGINRPVEFNQFGQITISNAELRCDMAANTCRWSDINGAGTSAAFTGLSNGTIDLGAPGATFPLASGAILTGNGTIKGGLVFASGVIAPGALSGPPYGTLSFTGSADLAEIHFDLDLGGATTGIHDAVQFGGTMNLGDISTIDGRGRLGLRLAPGYSPALGASVPVISYASVGPSAGFKLLESNYALDFATRFDVGALNVFPAPRLSIEDATLVEGNAGSAVMTFNVRLSQASAVPVTVSALREWSGTATNPSDYVAGVQNLVFAPGELLKSATATIFGNTVPEGDEAFSLELWRNGKLANAAFANGLRGRLAGVGTIVDDDLPPGTRVLLVGTDNPANHIRRYTTTGQFIDNWTTEIGPQPFNGYSGMCFSPDGKILTTRFWSNSGGPSLFSRHGARLAENFAGSVIFNSHESCVFARDGNVYVGQAGYNSGDQDSRVPVLKFSASGLLIDSFVIPTGERGTDWIELAGDQCTLYYTSEDTTVRRYNVCTRTALPLLTTTLSGPFCYALRLRQNRELMVACTAGVHRLDSEGNEIQFYPRLGLGETDVNGLFAINLDPDGTSFWTAGTTSGKVYRVDIASGAVLTTITGVGGAIGGLAIFDELGDDTIFVDGFELPPVVPIAPKSRLPCSASLIEAGDVFPQFIPDWLATALGADPDCSGGRDS